MTSKRQYRSIFTVFLFLTLSAGLLFAQYQSSQDPTAPPPAYGQGQSDSGYGQDQGGYPTPPPPNGQATYPDQQSYPQQQQGYPPQQGYPGQPGQSAPQQQQQQDPPGRVARLQYVQGEVSTQPGGVNDWVAASQNRPLTTSDRVWTDKNSRAELNVGDGFIRMNSETSVTLTNVSDNAVQLELDQGLLEVTVRHLSEGEVYEVDTPNYAFTIMKAGVYRFDVYPSEDQSWVTVRKGYGEATGNGAAVRVNSGEQVRFSNSNSLQHTAEAAPQRDGFDDWAQVRDKRLEDSQSARYVSPGVIGYQDLDGYGTWQSTPTYGNVWVPTSVPVGWAPYRYGHWVWVAPWGWTWVDDQPWGFAPFHYGRWVSWGGGWAWAPGPVGYWQPYYAPALVGWIGGPGFGVGFGFGGAGWGVGINFGWFPLGWGEPFYPRYCGWGWGGWYHGGGWVSNNYFHNVNITNTHITNITNVTNNYYNGTGVTPRYGFRNTPGAVTAAPASAITSGAAINRAGATVPASQLGKGNLLSAANVNPTHQSVVGGTSPATRGTPPASAFNRGVVTANKPPATRPASLQTANAATLSHGNLNALSSGSRYNAAAGGANSANNVARPGTTATANNGRVSQPSAGRVNQPAGKGSTAARGPVTAGNEARVDTTPTSQGGHYVPRPPLAGGASNPAPHTGSTGSAYSANGSNNYGHTNGTTSGAPVTNSQRYGTTQNPAAANNQRYGSTNSTVPHPPQSSSQPSYSATPHNAAPAQPSHPATSAPAPHNSAPSSSGSHESSSHGSGAALSVPRPPSGYSYHASPTYSASANYSSRPQIGSNNSNGRVSTPYFGNRSYGSSPSYSNRSYGSSPGYSNNRTYGSSPGYSNNHGPNPTYASRGMSSAPRASSGGGSSYRAPSGGGSSHGSSGGGSHSGGGGRR